MKRFDWRTFLFLLVLLSTTTFAANVIFGETDEDLFFYNEVLIDGVDLPEDLGSDKFVSSVEFSGAGSLTIAYQTGGGYPRISVFGGTTIKSERTWGEDDEKTAWEGYLPAPLVSQNPMTSDIVFDVEGNHEFSTVYPVKTFKMGLSNEEFSFSTPAKFSFVVSLPDGKRVWYAFKKTSGSKTEWIIDEGDFCVVKNGMCITDREEMNEVTLVQEFFSKCPRSRSSDTKIQNGFISGPPSCEIECNKGYILNDTGNRCVASSSNVDGGGDFGNEGVGGTDLQGEEPKPVRPGYIRYTGAGDQARRYLDTTGLEGQKKDQIARQNAALLKMVNNGEEVSIEEDVDNTKDGFLNYLLQIRSFFGANSAINTYSASSESGAPSEGNDNPKTSMEGEENHSSAPLLPSTGPGLFVGLAAMGLGLMVFGAKGRQ
ncbi:hypothetical protein K9L27_02475 [Candidatus Gracilibacteria bacterium]|nr:hypothetical protein [Candidatus Gracilibacteria bacterium]